MTQEQIAVELGLAGFPEDGPSRRKILQQASNYTQWCKTFGGRWLCFNSGIGSENFLWIKKMVNSSCRKSWQMIAENLSEVNVWKQAAKECRARRALALSRGVHMDTVSLQDVNGTEGGVEYWSGITVSMDVSTQPKTKAKAKAKAKSEAGGASGVKAIGTLEKTLKGYLAQEMLIKNQTEKLQNYQKGDPHNWAWADNLFNECAAKEANPATCKGTEFMHKFGAAALSPESLKKVKKEMGNEYHNDLVRSVDALKVPLEEWVKIIGKIQAMADAAGHLNEDGDTGDKGGRRTRRKISMPQGRSKSK